MTDFRVRFGKPAKLGQDAALALDGIRDFLGKLRKQRAGTHSAPSLKRLGGKPPPVGEFVLAQEASLGGRQGRGDAGMCHRFVLSEVDRRHVWSNPRLGKPAGKSAGVLQFAVLGVWCPARSTSRRRRRLAAAKGMGLVRVVTVVPFRSGSATEILEPTFGRIGVKSGVN